MIVQGRRRKAIEGRQRFQSKVKGGGTTNKEKERKKNFQMVKQSNRVKNKLKQSIRDQQQAAKRQVRRLQVLGKKANKRRRIQSFIYSYLYFYDFWNKQLIVQDQLGIKQQLVQST